MLRCSWNYKNISTKTVHTGQHLDENSEVFFKELQIPRPDYLIQSASGKPHGEQTALMMIEIEKICFLELPDAILLYGDTNSTLAVALVAAKLNIPQIHIEAGLRSYNRGMPEEVNRIIADEFAYLLCCPTDQAVLNLSKEGVIHPRIFRSGDVMCDILRIMEKQVTEVNAGEYYFATIHRPYNTDDLSRLLQIIKTLNDLNKRVIFSIHPRTSNILSNANIDLNLFQNISFIPPTGYADSIQYQKYSSCIITDSGGIQKEAYMLKRKCITLRKETEWIETLENGWNTLIFEDLNRISDVLNLEPGEYFEDLYGDGTAAQEIIGVIRQYI